jgi:hypothetical protein
MKTSSKSELKSQNSASWKILFPVLVTGALIFNSSLPAFAEIVDYKSGPCKTIQDLCLKSGFVMSGPKKDLNPRIDCVKLVAEKGKNNFIGPNGKKVVVDAKSIKECQSVRKK